MKSRTFCCSCEGFRKKNKRYDNVRRHWVQTRFVVDFIAEHTHVTASADMTHLHRSHRKITDAQASEIALVESSRIAPKAGMELMIKRAGGHPNLGFILDDCRNYLRTKRTMQIKDVKGFQLLYALHTDKDDFITNIFWADAQMNSNVRKKQKTIMTEQDAAMAKAIRSQWPETYHQLCIWHTLVVDHRYEELNVDFRVRQRNLAPSLQIEILNHATTLYTLAVSRMFEVEFSKTYNCDIQLCTEPRTTMEEFVLTPNGKCFHHKVKYELSGNIVICSCQMFKCAGILCSHILKVFSFSNVMKIPSQYFNKVDKTC
ncbi:hypothetical protein OSB04_002435 [Centaurea solstitialis]|uniref:SWIM-type domain-containing protein n=1 Tax=Centaurea solstitialis TaxID=347529 RepID=A0AA38TUS3_9ASTR|nr:hypothetical protein OSB04_002435 [Centaurea solstitialis]